MRQLKITNKITSRESLALDKYLHDISRIQMLSADEEAELARRIRSGDQEALDKLTRANLRFVVSVAKQYQNQGLSLSDLINEGNVGLMKAVKRYDPDRGVRLVSFAVHWIKAEIHEFILKNWRLVKVATTKAQRKLFFNLRGMKQGSTALSASEVNEVAKVLNVPASDVREMETRLYSQDIALDPQVEDDEESFAPIAYLAAPNAEPTEHLARAEREWQSTEGLQQALETLDERSRHIIQARWLAEDEAATLHELAAIYGISAERVRQVEAKALTKLKAAMAKAKPRR